MPASVPIKAKTPAIVPNQGKSRHPLKNESSPHSRAIPTRHALLLRHWMLDVSARFPICVHPRSSAVKLPASPITETRNPYPNPPLIKAKTPVIVHNRASSRQPPIFQTALHSVNPPAGSGGPAVERSKRVPRFSLSAGERAGVRASDTTNQSPFAPTRSQSRQKTSAIKANQASSRQTRKTNTIPSANGAAPYQPRATPWVWPRYGTSPEGAPQPANQGKKPLQSCIIKANQGKRRFFKQPSIRSTHPLDRADRQSKGQNVYQGSPSPRGRGPG